MKKEYIKPCTETYKLSPIHIVAESSGTTIDDNPGAEDIDVGDAREDNNNTDESNNRGSVWDNLW